MQVRFYELPASNAGGGDNEALIAHVVDIVAKHYQNRQYLTLICADKAQAEAFDEYIWQQPADAFIAHNLQGEGPQNGSPVEITWIEKLDAQPVRNKKVVVNISEHFLAQFATFHQLIDFVPSEATAKAQARERYKQYKQAGCAMQFVKAE